MSNLPRIVTPMVTPFTETGDLDLDTAANLAGWLVEQGNEGILVAGTTGEAPTLTHDEQVELIKTVVNAVDVPVMAGAGSNSTATAIELTERAEAAGAASILSVTPYYNRPSQAGLKKHFTAVAKSTDLDVYLYDIPIRTGRKIETSTLLELAHEVKNIVGLKDAAGNPSETESLIGNAPEDFFVYSGDDGLTLELMNNGAIGAIGVAMHWAAPLYKEMFSAMDRGDSKRASEIDDQLKPSYEFESMDEAPNPIPTKVLLAELGISVGECRPPLDTIPQGLAEKARTVLAGLGLK